MPDPTNSDVTLGEIDRRLRDMRDDFGDKLGNIRDDFGSKLADMTSELRSLRSELVRRDVYDANRITDQQRIFVVEGKVQDIEAERRLIRRLVYSSFFTALSGTAVTIGAHFLNTHH
jgi:hypothetical protein